MSKILASIFLLFCQFAFGQDVLDSTIVHLETIIYFDTNESSLTDDDLSKILQLLDEATKYSDYKLWVDAHTDEVGSESANLLLSEKRKDSVVSYLLSQKVSLDFIESDFHGESMRIARRHNNASRQLNRRVTVRLFTTKQFLYLEGTVIDEQTQKGIEADIQLRAVDFKSVTRTDTNGRFRILSPLNSNVTIEVVAKNYFIATKTLEITEKHKDVKLKIPLPDIKIGKIFNFEKILFVGNKSILLPTSYEPLEHLKRFMFENEDLCIEIAGHTNHPNQPKVEVNSLFYQLSVARALEVYDALNEIGVASDRMLARGYGNWNMVYPYAVAEFQMKHNRRVEIIISDCDSTATIQNQEVPNRAEFNRADPILRHYTDTSFQRDLENFNTKKIREDLTKQVKAMKKKDMDPTLYTYREMLMALPGLPPAKQ